MTVTLTGTWPSTVVEIADLPTANLPMDGTEQVVLLQNGVMCRAALTETMVLANYTVATLPSASVAGTLIYVTDEAGGAVPAFADGVDWRRVTDSAVVS